MASMAIMVVRRDACGSTPSTRGRDGESQHQHAGGDNSGDSERDARCGGRV